MTEYQIFKTLCQQGKIDFIDATTTMQWLAIFNQKGLNLSMQKQSLFLQEKLVTLNINEIKKFLPESQKHLSKHISLVYQTDSTSSSIRNDNSTTILIAEYQSSGRGRRGNHWVSPVGYNIYLSIKINYSSINNLSFIPIYISLLLATDLTDIGIDGLEVKWPNDLYLYGKKICGCLIDCYTSGLGSMLTIGVGLNVTMPTLSHININQPFSSLSEHYADKRCNRNYLLAKIIPSLYHCIETYNVALMDQYLTIYEKFNLFKQQKLLIKADDNHYYADYVGLNQDGSLKVSRENQIIDLYAADVSIRIRQ